METDLYPPVKTYLERLGFEIKGEICGCDVVGFKDGEEVKILIAELKGAFNLDLVLQAIDRQSCCDELWLAVRASRRGRGREKDPRVKNLCKLLGFGLLSVSANGFIEPIVTPQDHQPRRALKRRARLIKEHQARAGDPTRGGSTRQPIMTAYRQRALILAHALSQAPHRPRDLKHIAPDAPQILLRNVYGWFHRVERGVYGLNADGRAALARWPPPN